MFDAKNNKSFLESTMSVVIQEMVIADTSAVIMTKDPIEKRSVLAMETTYGPCEALVSGKVTGDLITVDRSKIVINKKELGSKRNKVVYDSFNGLNRGAYKLEPNANELQTSFSIDDSTVLRLAKIGLDIEEKFGQPQDIELVIAAGLIYVVQTRSITNINY
jgi:phosphoenolpyruvate synthase/pyruvate phosphate dikinase